MRTVALLLCLTLLLAACGAGEGTITIKTAGMRFVKEEVRVKAGQPVTLHVVNRDGYAHAFDMDEFDNPHPAGRQRAQDLYLHPHRAGPLPLLLRLAGA